MPRSDDDLRIPISQVPDIEKVLARVAQRTPPPIAKHYGFVTKFWSRIEQMENNGYSPQQIAEILNKEFQEANIPVKLDGRSLDHAIRSYRRASRNK